MYRHFCLSNQPRDLKREVPLSLIMREVRLRDTRREPESNRYRGAMGVGDKGNLRKYSDDIATTKEMLTSFMDVSHCRWHNHR